MSVSVSLILLQYAEGVAVGDEPAGGDHAGPGSRERWFITKFLYVRFVEYEY